MTQGGAAAHSFPSFLPHDRGNNADGQLGVNTTNTSPSPVQVADNRSYTSITAGERYSCATNWPDGAYCWWVAETAWGDTNACVRWLSIAGSAEMRASGGPQPACPANIPGRRGLGNDGRLGTNNMAVWSSKNVPGKVAGNQKFISISAGSSHTCGVDTTAAAWCWRVLGWRAGPASAGAWACMC